MIELSLRPLRLLICEPGEYYQGTRFDRAGIFRRIEKNGYVFADEWFSHCDPFRHDRVCGLSEEFVTVDFAGTEPGGLFCKPGVGLLRRPDEAPYDWFRLYEIAEPGIWDVKALATEAVFTHRLPGWYNYTKRISLLEDSGLEIAHRMDWEADTPLKGWFYNHNFFTFGGSEVGPSRRFRFPWQPTGDWRHAYDNVRFTPGGVEFLGAVDPALAVYCGNLHNACGTTSCNFEVTEGQRAVNVSGDKPLDHLVLWSNDRVACLEPYIPVSIGKGCRSEWSFTYKFF